jgi:2-desacetyl-2-hydroxyethyl bacteriochlorophyllide A dehydrogenase
VAVREEELCGPGAGQVLVEVHCSAISPGTEMLVYRGQAPADLAMDDSLSALKGTFQYPFQYGYSSVGEVLETGAGVDPAWRGRRVFSFHPHLSHFVAAVEEVQLLPEGLSADDAVFLPNLETAVNFIMDGRPMIGERVAVLGLGIVGLLTTSLLAAHPLGSLAGWDRYEARRAAARLVGATHAYDPLQGAGAARQAQGFLEKGAGQDGFDLVYELSGQPDALNLAIELAGFAARVVIGSWYGTKTAPIQLGGRFHRSRMQLISSQVSSLAPELLGRWDKSRRLAVAWEHLARLRPSRFITQRFALADAAQAFRLLAERPAETIQVVFT